MPDEHHLPPDPDGMNDDRAAWAEEALHTFGQTTRSDFMEDPLANLVDLLCDLHHWADRNGIDFATALLAADDHYTEETSD